MSFMITECRETSTDGWDCRLLCDGDYHYELIENPDPCDLDRGVRVVGRCDGTCRLDHPSHRVDVREAVAKLQAAADGPGMVFEEGEYLPDDLTIDAASQALLDGDGPIVGHEFDSYYCKRDSRGRTVCTGEHHVKLTTNFEWWSGCSNPEFAERHSVSSVPCDGSCQPRQRPVSKRLRRLLRIAVVRLVRHERWIAAGCPPEDEDEDDC